MKATPSRSRQNAAKTAPRGGDRVTLRVESLAAGGAGVGRLQDGAVVFVPGAASGELVSVIVDRASNPPRGRSLQVVEASPERVAPACPHVGKCGGCDWMHLSTGAQQSGHEGIVERAITHALGGAAVTFQMPEIRVHPATHALGYRTRARLFLASDRRLVRVGYRAVASHDLAPVDACVVLDPAIAQLVRDLGEVLAGARGDGDASVARGRGGLPVVSLAFRGDLPPSAWAALDARVACGAWAGAEVTLAGAAQPATFGDPRPVLRGADGVDLVIAAGGFAQPSDEGASALARRVDELSSLEAGTQPRPGKVVELFAGSGTLSVLLARRATSFSAIEIAPRAAEAARENLRARGLAGRVTTGDADAASIPAETTTVVLDPPRAGAAGACRAIAASSARVVVYVACDPATLARDLAILTASGKLAITHVETFELFPQTSHVETVVRLARR